MKHRRNTLSRASQNILWLHLAVCLRHNEGLSFVHHQPERGHLCYCGKDCQRHEGSENNCCMVMLDGRHQCCSVKCLLNEDGLGRVLALLYMTYAFHAGIKATLLARAITSSKKQTSLLQFCDAKRHLKIWCGDLLSYASAFGEDR